MSGQSASESVLATARAMNSQGLNQGSAGNVSVRDGGGFWITPSALPYDRCGADDMVWLDLAGQARGRRKPSSEWRMHADIYRTYPQAGAILHAHSPYCTTLACLERSIPAFHYMVAMAGGDSIRCAPYATFGTQALSDAAIAALRDRSAALLAHHGMICHAADLDRVLALAIEVETLARIYLQALAVAEPPVLPAAEMAEVLRRFKDYKA
ncbi:class II aldolase/adducin family protein [Desulfobulbus elongatus]|uniref:class II aldolase/adducin family protein n=1 Tax=Desulfobulbus elongatus TaxID=53332 RepID=UPI000485DC89|nr:class II aldolase/adducin family protein [Desulfobulbus elongatus]